MKKILKNISSKKVTPFHLLFTVFFIQCVAFGALSQNKYSTFYYQRTSLFQHLPSDTTDIVFLGNSITNGGEWVELFNNAKIKNRGISGDICEGVYDPITKGKPDKIFLMIGVNDMARGTSIDSIAHATKKIIYKIQQESPKTVVFLQSVLPMNPDFGMFEGHTKRTSEVKSLNKQLSVVAEETNITYIDLYSYFILPQTEKMNPEYTNDGLHLTGKGYLKWAEIVKPYVEK